MALTGIEPALLMGIEPPALVGDTRRGMGIEQSPLYRSTLARRLSRTGTCPAVGT